MQTRDFTSEVLTFTSTAHPGTLPWGFVYGRALVQPIAACMLPVMVLTLVAVLEGVRILPGVFWASGAALLVASAWTTFRLQRVVAEIRVTPEMASIRTVWEVMSDEPHWKPVLAVRDYGSWADVTIGLASYEIERDRWENYDELIAALKSCWRAGHLPG